MWLATLVLVPTVSYCPGMDCACSETGVAVSFNGGVTSADVATFTATGDACGTVPSPLCGGSCDSTSEAAYGWSVSLFPPGPGTCSVHIVLTDGETFDDTVNVLVPSSGGCCDGPYGDHVIEVTPHHSFLDGGLGD
jgi:hypothetical protein